MLDSYTTKRGAGPLRFFDQIGLALVDDGGPQQPCPDFLVRDLLSAVAKSRVRSRSHCAPAFIMAASLPLSASHTHHHPNPVAESVILTGRTNDAFVRGATGMPS